MGNFVGKPLLVYLDEGYKVADIPALAAQVDGFLLRGVKNVYDLTVRPGKATLNSDAWKQETDAQTTDNSYFAFYDAIRAAAPDKPIYMVIEGNPAVDRQDYNRSDAIGLSQMNAVRRVVQTSRYLPDVFLVKIVDSGWWENGRWVDCTPVNFAACYDGFFKQLFNKYRKETEGWSGADWIKTTVPDFGLQLDTWNNPAFGGPHYPFAFSWYPPSVPNGRTLPSLKQMLTELTDPVETINVDTSNYYAKYNGQTWKQALLTVGSFTGADLSGNKCYGLWGFDQNNYFDGVTDAKTGKPRALEVFSFFLQVSTWKDYIAFIPAKPADDTTPPTAPSGLTATTVSGHSVALQWIAATDNVGVDHYVLIRNGAIIQSALTGVGFTDNSVTPDTQYTYVLQAVDAAGNVSGESNSASLTTPKDDTPPPADGDVLQALARISGQLEQIAAEMQVISGQNADTLTILKHVFNAGDGLTFKQG